MFLWRRRAGEQRVSAVRFAYFTPRLNEFYRKLLALARTSPLQILFFYKHSIPKQGRVAKATRPCFGAEKRTLRTTIFSLIISELRTIYCVYSKLVTFWEHYIQKTKSVVQYGWRFSLLLYILFTQNFLSF